MAEATPGAVASEAPVETPVAAPEATTAPETTAVEGEAPEGGEKPEAAPERTFTQKEVNEIAAKRAAQAERHATKVAQAQARAEFAERQLEALRQPQQPAPQSGEPRAEDFKGKTYEDYMRAVIDWRVQNARSQWEQDSQAQAQQRQAFEQSRSVQEKLKPAFEKYPDFKEVALSEDVPISQPMAAFIAQRDPSGDVAYHLGQNISEATRIAQLAPVDQVIAMQELKTKLTATPAPTRTPPPIVPSSPAAKVGTPADAKEFKGSDKEYNDWRKRQIAQRPNRR